MQNVLMYRNMNHQGDWKGLTGLDDKFLIGEGADMKKIVGHISKKLSA